MEPEPTRRDLAAIRRLNAALGIENPYHARLGLLIGAVIAAVTFGAIMMLALSGGPPVMVYGVVRGFGLRESDFGSFPVARVWVDDRSAVVRLDRSSTCTVGSRIKLNRRRALLGYRYNAGWLPPCPQASEERSPRARQLSAPSVTR